MFNSWNVGKTAACTLTFLSSVSNCRKRIDNNMAILLSIICLAFGSDIILLLHTTISYNVCLLWSMVGGAGWAWGRHAQGCASAFFASFPFSASCAPCHRRGASAFCVSSRTYRGLMSLKWEMPPINNLPSDSVSVHISLFDTCPKYRQLQRVSKIFDGDNCFTVLFMTSIPAALPIQFRFFTNPTGFFRICERLHILC